MLVGDNSVSLGTEATQSVVPDVESHAQYSSCEKMLHARPANLYALLNVTGVNNNRSRTIL